MTKIDLLKYYPTKAGHLDIHHQDFCKDIARDRYMREGEGEDWAALCKRVASIVQGPDANKILHALKEGLFVPGGRIWAGAETNDSDGLKRTLMNCYVSGTIEDSLEGIYKALGEGACTLSYGGGIGYDFTPIRPKGAYVSGSGVAGAAGPVHFMSIFDASCKVIEQAGNRRGAQMAILDISHPDIEDFIKSKSTGGALTQFNISVAVPNSFMKALKGDDKWTLWHPAPKKEGQKKDYSIAMGHEPSAYKYGEIGASYLWDLIMTHTYQYSEPGVFFVDRVNDRNPLKKVEYLAATNPCGEQPLPPYGCCNLGAINLARLVENPFTNRAVFRFDLLEELARLGIIFLDSVITKTKYPLKEQQVEAFRKRRIGLGITGLANALDFMGYEYGGTNGISLASRIMACIAREANAESRNLGSYVEVTLVREDMPPQQLWRRNGTLTTIAPTGTTSIIVGNVSSGIEPTFAPVMKRQVRARGQGDVTETHEIYDYAELIRRHVGVDRRLFNTMDNLTIEDHLLMQSTLQKHVDSSISKTINLPEDISYEDFKEVYSKAYSMGLNSCTTYRPSEVRGSIIQSADTDTGASAKTEKADIANRFRRQVALSGVTAKIKWPEPEETIYITVNFQDMVAKEVFITCRHAGEYLKSLSIMISRLLQEGADIRTIAEDLKEIYGDSSGRWIHKKWHKSLVACIGHTIEQIDKDFADKALKDTEYENIKPNIACQAGLAVVDCEATYQEGCYVCIRCGFSRCE